MKNIAIIPARGGSKRIQKKNIKHFLDRPIIAYSIEAAIGSGLFEEVMVSTDDEEIAKVSISFGAKIPFMRSKINADDYATLSDVMLEVLSEYLKKKIKFDNVCCILPTAPLLSVKRLTEAYERLLSDQYTSVTPVVKYSYPIYRALIIDDNNYLSMNWPEYLKARSQDLPATYHDSGSFYWVKSNVFQMEKTLFTRDGTGIVLEEIEAQDLDSEMDWEIAEIKYKMLHG
ncbi:MAG: CMP-N-acetylneuraminic acid synthetase [Bacteroides sp. SM23_62]|nr:MAG: CMP-N-acetylneuraminic acid synthetase [Bacteroides sp. SM23_62]